MSDEFEGFDWASLYHKKLANVQLMAPNFRGLANQYNPAGRRTFCVILPEDIGSDMWRIESRRSDDGVITQYVPARIPSGFDFSKITLDGRSLTDGDEDMTMLDLGKNLICDVELVGRPWRLEARNGYPAKTGFSTFLVSLDARTV
ncbi:single strand annealing protein [Arthrobacter phage Qui]|jgi:hypothetical protein|uniref:Uncharacterized protein n=1 Tax=Arthrobacter phage Qui TaxID=2603260 RepID=A0A5B8WH80_9CAUD|nr:single strand annealing protein [Arthrobacter phage Qui]QED11661.1 hypothetical protein SEA_QUI_173 [Arthrobacter phage Qui]QOC56492.1 hypothetical protein SEA_PAELLA_173 [Arthrobacter phage Paella]